MPDKTIVLKEYTCTITLVFDGNKHEAEDEQGYKYRVKDNFFDEFGIKLTDENISNIKESQ